MSRERFREEDSGFLSSSSNAWFLRRVPNFPSKSCPCPKRQSTSPACGCVTPFASSHVALQAPISRSSSRIRRQLLAMTELRSGGGFGIHAQFTLLVVKCSVDAAMIFEGAPENRLISRSSHGKSFVRHSRTTRVWLSKFYRLTQPTARAAFGRYCTIWRVREHVDMRPPMCCDGGNVASMHS